MMNKFYAMVLALLVSASAWAQKGSPTKAQVLLDKNDVIGAKAEIDAAMANPKQAGKSRTWYIRGLVYQAIATSEDMEVSSIDPEAIQKAGESYSKVKEMEKETNPTAFSATQKQDALWGHFIDKANQAYTNEDYELALSNFEKSIMAKPGDSVSTFYAGAVAQQMENYDVAEKHYMNLKSSYVLPESGYQALVYFARVKEDNEKALTLVKEAKEAYPANKDFVNEELTILIVLNKLDEAETKLKAALADDPSVVQNHLNLAVLYDNLSNKFATDGDEALAAEKFELATKSYNDALSLEPNNYIANFNMGALYINRAKVSLDKVRDMDLATYSKKGGALEEKAKVDLKGAKPYFEKVIEIEPSDVQALSTLQSIYSNLKMYDEAEAIKSRIEKLDAQ